MNTASKVQHAAHHPRSQALAFGQDDKWFWSLETLFYATLLVFVAMVSLTMIGCTKPEGEKVDYGPEVSEASVLKAIRDPLASADPTQIKVGEFVHTAEIQELAGGQARNTLSDTGQTVIDRQETAEEILFTIVETKISYVQGESRKASTEFNVRVAKSLTGNEPQLATASSAPATLQTLATISQSLRQSSAERLTYHNLKITSGLEAPPDAVSSQPNCLGLANCKLNVTRVSFDQVAWSGEKSDRTHYEFALSPDAPYLGQVLNTCLTMMVPINDTGAKTLLKQCKPVVNFRFEAAN
jgi:hypothetical protein